MVSAPDQGRCEIKYLLNEQEARILSGRLSEILPRDPHAGPEGDYFIRSLYFDTFYHRCFHERLEGLSERKKFRIRFYDFDSPRVRFEIKSKLGERSYKRGSWIDRSVLRQMNEGNYDALMDSDDPVLHRVYAEFKRSMFRPAVIVDYRREAFMGGYDGDLRITLDRQLRRSSSTDDAGDPGAATYPMMKKFHVILEIKYNRRFPKWLASWMGIQRFQHCAQSKYYFARMI